MTPPGTTPADRIVVAVAAALVGALFALYWRPPAAAQWVEVRSQRAPAERHALAGVRTLAVPGRLGDSVLQLESGRVRFVTSPCRNQVCVRSGWQEHAGDSAACLPNRVSISLGGGEAGAFDALSY